MSLEKNSTNEIQPNLLEPKFKLIIIDLILLVNWARDASSMACDLCLCICSQILFKY